MKTFKYSELIFIAYFMVFACLSEIQLSLKLKKAKSNTSQLQNLNLDANAINYALSTTAITDQSWLEQ